MQEANLHQLIKLPISLPHLLHIVLLQGFTDLLYYHAALPYKFYPLFAAR